jgi:hypothetical protein
MKNDRVLDYEIVEAAAREHGIAIRGGCFCNPGAAEQAFSIPARRSRACLRREFSVPRFRACLGKRPSAPSAHPSESRQPQQTSTVC